MPTGVSKSFICQLEYNYRFSLCKYQSPVPGHIFGGEGQDARSDFSAICAVLNPQSSQSYKVMVGSLL